MTECVHNCVRRYRKKHNMTQQDLAQQVHVTRQTIIAIEKGNYTPSVLLAMRLARTLETSTEALFSLPEDQ